MATPSAQRVPLHTRPAANEAIVQRTIRELRELVNADPDALARRLDQLDAEWDTERVLETNAATLALVGLVLGATIDRRFLVLPGLVAAFLLQHAIQGWCPPLPLIRALKIRTRREIDAERTAIKLLRGDFKGLHRGAKDDELNVQRLVEAALR